MRCPKCSAKMSRSSYEHLPILTCSHCRGMIVRKARLQAIKNRREKQLEDFKDEIADAAPDTEQRLRCSECHTMMEKRKKHFGPTHFMIDRCRRCDLYWLDDGELAKLQLIFEYSDQGIERARIRDHFEQMSPQQRRELDERIAKLPEMNLFTDSLWSMLEGGAGRHTHWELLDDVLDLD